MLQEQAVISHIAESRATLILKVTIMFKRFAELGHNFALPTVKMLYFFPSDLNFCFDYVF